MDHRLEKRQRWVVGVGEVGIVALERRGHQSANQIVVAGGCGVLESPHPQVACRDAGEHSPGKDGLALHGNACRRHREGAGGRDPERVHGLADEELPQHRPDGGQSVAPSRERCAPRPLQMQVAQTPVRCGDLAEQQRAAVAEHGRIAAELVPRVGLRDGHRGCGEPIAREEADTVAGAQRRGVEAQFDRERLVEHEQPGIGELRRVPRHRQLREGSGEARAEFDDGLRRDGHGPRLRREWDAEAGGSAKVRRHRQRPSPLTA